MPQPVTTRLGKFKMVKVGLCQPNRPDDKILKIMDSTSAMEQVESNGMMIRFYNFGLILVVRFLF